MLLPHFYIAKLGYVGVNLLFLFFLQNIDCGYMLEPPQLGDSIGYPQSMFWIKNKLNRHTPVHPSFKLQKWGIRGYILYAHVFVMF